MTETHHPHVGPQHHDETFGIEPDVYRRRWLVLAILCVSLVVIVMGVSSLNNALPRLAEALDPTASQLQWIVDAYSLVFAGALLTAGALGDRFGRRGALVFGLVVFGLAALAGSQADNPTQLIAARSVMGFGAAFIMPATLSIIVNTFPMHERPRAIALWAAFAGVGSALGPVASGILLQHFWWGSVFFANLPLVVLLIVLAVWLVPTSRDPKGHALDPIGAALSVVALVALVYAVIEGPDKGWTSAPTIAGFAVAAAGGLAFVWWELRTPNPTLDPRLFRLRGFSMGSLAITLVFFSQFGFFFAFTQYMQFVKGYDPLEAAVRQLPLALMIVLVSPRSPKLVARFGVRKVVTAGFLFAALGFFVVATFQASTPYWLIVVGLLPLGTGMACIMPPASQMIVGSVPLAKSGVGSAVNDVTREVGGALGIAVLGSILATGYRNSIASALGDLPQAVRDAASGSITEAARQAHQLADPAQAGALLQSAGSAFTDAIGVAFVIAGCLSLIAAAVVGRRIPDALPNRAGPPPGVEELAAAGGHGAEG